MKSFNDFLNESVDVNAKLRKYNQEKIGEFDYKVNHDGKDLTVKLVAAKDKDNNTVVSIVSNDFMFLKKYDGVLSLKDAIKNTEEYLGKMSTGNVYRSFSKYLTQDSVKGNDTDYTIQSIYVNNRGRQVIVLSKAIKNGKEVWKENDVPKGVYLGLKYQSSREDTIKKLKDALQHSKFKFSEGDDLLK